MYAFEIQKSRLCLVGVAAFSVLFATGQVKQAQKEKEQIASEQAALRLTVICIPQFQNVFGGECGGLVPFFCLIFRMICDYIR